MEKVTYKSLDEIYKRSKYLYNQFDFKVLETLEKTVSKTRLADVKNQVRRMLEYAPELEFILNGQSKQYAKEIFKILQMTFIKLNGLEQITNADLQELIQYEVEKIEKMCVIIESNNEFKYVSQNDQHRFNKQEWLYNVEVESEQDVGSINIFFQDLDGGMVASEIGRKAAQNTSKDIKIYGIDEDIKNGEKSRDYGINVARGGVLETSKQWVDVAFVANTRFGYRESNVNYTKTEMAELIKSKVLKKNGLVVFNYPYYKVFEIRQFLEKNKVQDWKYLDDTIGNLLIVVSMGETDENIDKTIEAMTYKYGRNKDKKVLLKVKAIQIADSIRFRGKYTDLNDIVSNEFLDKEASMQFIEEYYSPTAKSEKLTTPLVEVKAGHIPAIASSESVNGRYVDEIYEYLGEDKKQFDHIHSTKIVKREIEEETTENKNGIETKVISVKKSNVIHSVVLTADGKYIELFGAEKNGGE